MSTVFSIGPINTITKFTTFDLILWKNKINFVYLFKKLMCKLLNKMYKFSNFATSESKMINGLDK